MGYDIRHESNQYLEALLSAAADVGEQKQRILAQEQDLQERRMRLAEQAQADENERFRIQLQTQQQAQQAGYQNQQALNAQEIQGKSDLLSQQFQLQNESLRPQLRYTQEQLREDERLRTAIQKVQSAPNLRPAQKQAAIARLLDRRAQILPQPDLPRINANEPSPVQQAYKDRVFMDQARGGMWVLQPDDKLEFQKFDDPQKIDHADIAKMFDTATKLLTIPGGNTGTDKLPSKQDVYDFVMNYMLPAASGKPVQSPQANPWGQPFTATQENGAQGALFDQNLLGGGQPAANPQIRIPIQNNNSVIQNAGGLPTQTPTSMPTGTAINAPTPTPNQPTPNQFATPTQTPVQQADPNQYDLSGLPPQVREAFEKQWTKIHEEMMKARKTGNSQLFLEYRKRAMFLLQLIEQAKNGALK